MAVKSIPDGFTTATPYLHVRDAAAAIAFWKNAFGAEETMRMSMPDGKIGHAEVRIGNAIIMLAHTLGGTSFGMCLYVDDCDAVFQKALAAGATELRPMIDQFYGDRSGTVVDPFGHVWTIATHQEDVSAAEMEARMAAWAQSSAAA
jgi:PhnB protein